MEELHDRSVKEKHELWVLEIVPTFLNLAGSGGFETEARDGIAKKK